MGAFITAHLALMVVWVVAAPVFSAEPSAHDEPRSTSIDAPATETAQSSPAQSH